MKLFVIESDSPYYIKISEIENLEDAGDDFVTEDELKEMLGDDVYITTYTAMVKNQAVTDKLHDLKRQIQEKGTKTIIIDDEALVEFFAKCEYSVSYFVGGLRRVGNRLFIHTQKKRTTVNKSDAITLIKSGIRAVNKKYKFGFNLTNIYKDYEGAVELLKKLTTLEEVTECANDSRYGDFKQHIPFFDEIWKNPSVVLPFVDFSPK